MSVLRETRPGASERCAPVWRGLGRLLAEHRGSLVAVGLLVLAAALIELLPPLVIRDIVDRHLTTGDRAGLPRLAALYLAGIAGVQVMTFSYGYLAATVAQRVLSDLRTRLFAHVQQLPASYFDRVPTGDVISRCTADVDTLDTVFSSGVAVLVANLVRLVTIASAMVALSPALSAMAAVIAVPLVLVTRAMQVRVRQAERDNRLAVGAVNVGLQEDLTGVEVIRAFGREPEFVAGFRRVLRRGLLASNRSSLYSALYTPSTAIVSATAVAALLAAASGRAFGDTGISIGSLTAFVLLLQRFFQPVTALGEEWQTVQGALAGAERIFDTLALTPDRASADGLIARAAGRDVDRAEARLLQGELRDPRAGRGGTDARDARVATPSIALERVEFGYSDREPVLRGVSLRVAAGEHVALVGRTGAGKTTALQLLAGLYRPWAGRVIVAGRDPAGLGEAERNRVLGVVPQVVQLFSGTVSENLTLGHADVTEDHVYEAAIIAGAHSFIRELPQGYRTPLSGVAGGGGTPLSAGQRQLLALARALVHRPAALLLDEATSAIDNATDAAFRAALRERVLARGAAVLTIAHRLATALDADRVIVLDKGQVVEGGSPAALIASQGRFAALLELEAAGWDWRSGA